MLEKNLISLIKKAQHDMEIWKFGYVGSAKCLQRFQDSVISLSIS